MVGVGVSVVVGVIVGVIDGVGVMVGVMVVVGIILKVREQDAAPGVLSGLAKDKDSFLNLYNHEAVTKLKAPRSIVTAIKNQVSNLFLGNLLVIISFILLNPT
jgi:hypothetical protein